MVHAILPFYQVNVPQGPLSWHSAWHQRFKTHDKHSERQRNGSHKLCGSTRSRFKIHSERMILFPGSEVTATPRTVSDQKSSYPAQAGVICDKLPWPVHSAGHGLSSHQASLCTPTFPPSQSLSSSLCFERQILPCHCPSQAEGVSEDLSLPAFLGMISNQGAAPPRSPQVSAHRTFLCF